MDALSDALLTMLQLQRMLNERHDPDWYNKHPPFLRLAIITTASALHHHGCDLWHTPAPDWKLIRTDLSRLLPLLLSYEMLRNGRRDDELARIARKLQVLLEVGQKTDFFPDASFAEKLEHIIARASADQIDALWPAYFATLKDAQQDWETLCRTYFSDNALQLFRQDYGDETGDYSSNWGGKEDSEHLQEIMAHVEKLDLPAIRHALVMRYSTLAGRRSTDRPD